MCGIAGAIDTMAEQAVARISRINAAQTHRGPDNTVVARTGGIILGNTWLAIQDPTAAGSQPLVSADGQYTCIFNSEISDRTSATPTGLTSTYPRCWAKTRALTALNAWLETWTGYSA